MIHSQDFKDFETICVDSGSTDGTFEILQKYNPTILYQIKPEDYIPGLVLNNAIEKCNGEIIVFNNSDCIPQNNQWLEELIKPLLDETEDKLVSTFGRQIPRPDAHELVKKDYNRAFGDGKISASWFHFFSLATSAIKTSSIREFPFDNDIQYSEDIEWSFRMKNKGFKINYVKDSIVEHSHNYKVREIFKRFKGEGKADAKIYRNNYKFFNMIKNIISETLRDFVYLSVAGKYHLLFYCPLHRSLQRFGVYMGYREFLKQNKK
jgi:rhamnosyltransferase